MHEPNHNWERESTTFIFLTFNCKVYDDGPAGTLRRQAWEETLRNMKSVHVWGRVVGRVDMIILIQSNA